MDCVFLTAPSGNVFIRHEFTAVSYLINYAGLIYGFWENRVYCETKFFAKELKKQKRTVLKYGII